MNTVKLVVSGLLVVGLLAAIGACSDERTIVTPDRDIAAMRPGEFHNRTIDEIYEVLERKSGKATDYTLMQISDACYEVANEILEPSGVYLEPETVTQILLDGQAVGSRILNDPTPELQAISEEIFGDDTSSLPSGGRSADFFNRFLVVFEAEYARGNNAAYSYQIVCNELGVPIPGTDLDSVLDVLVASDEYWSEQHPEEWGGANKWWNFKRIIAVVATDGVSGFLAGAGYGSIGGPGGCAAGATVGGVVGVLSSIGFNDIVFN